VQKPTDSRANTGQITCQTKKQKLPNPKKKVNKNIWQLPMVWEIFIPLYEYVSAGKKNLLGQNEKSL